MGCQPPLASTQLLVEVLVLIWLQAVKEEPAELAQGASKLAVTVLAVSVVQISATKRLDYFYYFN